MNHFFKRAFGPCFLFAVAVFFVQPLAAAELMSATISHTIRQVTDNGITKTTEYKERIIRGPNDVWIERVLPSTIKRSDEHSDASKGHKHLDVERAARWISKNSKGQMSFRLVDLDHKVIVEIAPADYSNVAFDGRWDTAYHLISPGFLKTLKAQGEAIDDVQRYQSDNAKQNVEVQWNKRLEIPISMQFFDKTGTSLKKATVSVESAKPKAPWNTVVNYSRKELSDYLD